MSVKIDHTTIRPGGPPKDTATSAERRWWLMSPQEACGAIGSSIEALNEQERARASQLVRSMRLYGNVPLHGFYGLGPHQATIDGGPYRDRISLNVSQAVVDTATSKIAKNKPRPYYVTSAGDADQQRRAKNRNKLIDGVFYENNAHRLGMFGFRDGCILGDGIIHVYSRNGRVKYERVLCSELKVDEIEGSYGQPRQLHRQKLVDRHVLMDCFPSHKEKLKDAVSAWKRDVAPARQHLADMLLVRESWHLPSGPEASDGKHILTLDDFALTPMMDWDHDFFPFARYSWSTRPSGYWSQGLVEQIQPIQLEINKILLLVQRSYHLGGTFKVLMEMGSKISPEHINNQIGAIIKYQGVKPEYIVPQLLPPEIYQQLRWLVDQAYEQSGINRLASAGQLPVGMEKASGTALRTMGDIQSDRFQTNGREYDELFMQLSRITFAVLKDMFEAGELKSYDVKVPHQRWIERLDIRDVDLDDDDNFIMQCFPVSSLPQEPAGRLATVTEMMQSGLVDPQTGKRLLNFPDIEQEENLSGAAEDWLEKILTQIVDDGEYTAPEPYDNPQRGFELAQQYYLSGKRDNLPPDRLELLRLFMDDCQDLVQAAQPPTPQTATPQNPPVPPQQSELVQNVPGMGAA